MKLENLVKYGDLLLFKPSKFKLLSQLSFIKNTCHVTYNLHTHYCDLSCASMTQNNHEILEVHGTNNLFSIETLILNQRQYRASKFQEHHQDSYFNHHPINTLSPHSKFNNELAKGGNDNNKTLSGTQNIITKIESIIFWI
uniref:Uncharacterized protein n=1 Tax=Rhizophora mucronata TaxID=61149 RepID=A0A2P2NLP6_RHIMU